MKNFQKILNNNKWEYLEQNLGIKDIGQNFPPNIIKHLMNFDILKISYYDASFQLKRSFRRPGERFVVGIRFMMEEIF